MASRGVLAEQKESERTLRRGDEKREGSNDLAPPWG